MKKTYITPATYVAACLTDAVMLNAYSTPGDTVTNSDDILSKKNNNLWDDTEEE